MSFSLAQRAFAEFLGTAFLLAIVVGSGIMGEKLSGGNAAIALLANAIATGAGLFCLITIFGAISGAHFNTVVSLAESWRGDLAWKDALIYLISQISGGIVGVGLANYMFELPVFFASTKIREGNAQFVSEFVATFGLLAVIQAGAKFKPTAIAGLVAAYITAAYWFTSSTSFANPAVTIARAFSDTFTGICPKNVLPFVISQFAGATISVLVFRWLLKEKVMIEKKKILILCTGNSARSQMAEGLLKHITQNKYDIFSAGTKPSIVRPEAIKVLSEISIDISNNRSKSVDEFAGEEIAYILTVCDNAKEDCPYFPVKTKLIHRSFKDPAEVEGDEETRLNAFRKIRDEIKEYFEIDFVKIIEAE